METIYLKSSATYLNTFAKYDKLEEWEKKDLFENGEFKFFLKNLKLQSKKIIGNQYFDGLFNYQYIFSNTNGDIVKYYETYLNQTIKPNPKRNFTFSKDLYIKPIVSNNGYNFNTKSEVYKRDIDDDKKEIKNDRKFNVNSIVNKMEKDNQVIIRFIPHNITHEDIRYLYSQFGNVMSIKLLSDKRIAFITFANKKSVEKALMEKVTMGHLIIRAEIPKASKR
jgi:hypothetical protein